MASSQCVVLRFPGISIPAITNRAMPQRRKNSVYRSREYLTESEVARLIDAAGETGRHRHRDATLLMLAYRHGLRVSELIGLRWDQLDFEQSLLHVNRLKHGTASVHPLHETELSALKILLLEYPKLLHVFCSERKMPLTADAIRKIIARAGQDAGLPFAVHPHMLRHACGYKLAQAGEDTRAIQDYLGHRNIQHTVRYTQLSSERFRSFWKD